MREGVPLCRARWCVAFLLLLVVLFVVAMSSYTQHMSVVATPLVGDYTPKLRMLDRRVRLQECANFLTPVECARVIGRLRDDKFVQSNITFGDAPHFRTSKTVYLTRDHPVSKALDDKIASLLGVDPAFGETLQVTRYDVGHEFKAHTDYFSEQQETEKATLETGGQRTWTCMIYLNDVPRGGHTHFTQLEHKIKPQPGTALVWDNLLPGSQVEGNPETVHAGRPVLEGRKYIATKWYRTRSQV